MIDEDFSTYEEDLIVLLDKISSTISTFNTLSKIQAENAILETNIKISSCKELITKMEAYINQEDLKEEINKNDLNRKITNYKNEYHELINKYNTIQENYISEKAKNALIDSQLRESQVNEEENNENENPNKVVETSGKFVTDGELKDDIKNKEENRVSNVSNNTNDVSVISVNNVSSLPKQMELHTSFQNNDNSFQHDTYEDDDKKKEKLIIACVCCCVFIFLIIIIISLATKN